MKKILISLLLIGAPIWAMAYTETTSGSSVTSKVVPTNPASNQLVTISLISYGLDLNSSKINWSLDGKNVSSGIGNRSYSFTTGALGTSNTVIVDIEDQTGQISKKTFVFRSAEVDLLWEAKTYTPPFYRGKALPTSESIIKVSALANLVGTDGQKIKNSNLVYEWQKDGRNLPTMSGYGKSSITFKSDKLYGQNTVSVVVSDLTSKIKTEKSLSFSIQTPKIVFYEQKPLDGILFNQAISQGKISETDFNLRAEPYFFSSKDLASLKYDWTLNGKALDTKGLSNTLTIVADQKSSNENAFKLQISNPISLLQVAGKSINFTRQKSLFSF